MVSNEYNEIGELVTKNLHETTTDKFVQSVDYRRLSQARKVTKTKGAFSSDMALM